jgi:hypothetical protein
MHITGAAWERSLADLGQTIDDCARDRFVARLRPGHALGLFERASAEDSTGLPDFAVSPQRADAASASLQPFARGAVRLIAAA